MFFIAINCNQVILIALVSFPVFRIRSRRTVPVHVVPMGRLWPSALRNAKLRLVSADVRARTEQRLPTASRGIALVCSWSAIVLRRDRLWWREQRRGDGAGAVFAPRHVATSLRRWSGVEAASELLTRRPCRADLEAVRDPQPAGGWCTPAYPLSRDTSSKAIYAAIDSPDLMLRSGD